MTTRAENDLMTRIDGGAPMGRLIRDHYWIPFAQSAHLVHGEGPTPVRLIGENYAAFRAEDGRIGFLNELCPHRRASLLLARIEGNAVRCIYHGWKIDAAGQVVECPTQTVRPERFAANVAVGHYPVHEAGGLAWVWLGGKDAPAFPALPFADEDLYRYWVTCQLPCNWLQGLEGSVDSVHAGMLHQTWIAKSVGMAEHANLGFALAEAPTYETEATSYGLRAAALRKTTTGQTYVRVTEHLMPLVTITSAGSTTPRTGAVFVISPVDDTHHIMFFGTVGPTPHSGVSLDQIAMQDPAYAPEPLDYTGLTGDRATRWGQDRSLMAKGHFTGFGRSLLEEDAAVQSSMGPIVDRSEENLSSSDVAVAHLRRMLLEALSTTEKGQLPPGSAFTPEGVRLPNAVEMLVDEGTPWEDAALHAFTELSRSEPGPMPTTFEDWHAINTLLMVYAERLDLGRNSEVAVLFAHATYRVEHSGTTLVSEYRGESEVRGFCEQTRVYEDGTPRTKHVITNVNIQVDGDQATASSYATVFQQTDLLPLQPIASGRYLDRFERVDGGWRFADRLITGFLLGDRSQHVPWHEGTPETAGS